MVLVIPGLGHAGLEWSYPLEWKIRNIFSPLSIILDAAYIFFLQNETKRLIHAYFSSIFSMTGVRTKIFKACLTMHGKGACNPTFGASSHYVLRCHSVGATLLQKLTIYHYIFHNYFEFTKDWCSKHESCILINELNNQFQLH